MFCTLLHVLEETSLRECLCFKVLAIDVSLKIISLLQNCIIVLDFNVFFVRYSPLGALVLHIYKLLVLGNTDCLETRRYLTNYSTLFVLKHCILDTQIVLKQDIYLLDKVFISFCFKLLTKVLSKHHCFV